MTRRRSRTVLALFAGLLAALAFASCGDAGSSAGGLSAASTPAARAFSDPSSTGPYAVGTTTMTWTRPSTTTGEPRVLETILWYPAMAAARGDVIEDAAPLADAGTFPVVIFSHGHGGGPRNAEYLMEHLASWGYLVAAPPHPGNTSADCGGRLCPYTTLPDSARNRVPDVEFVLDSLLALRDDPASALGAVVDPDRAAIIGHSFGGWTALMASPGGRFDAIIGLAPATIIPGIVGEHTDVPVLFMAAGKDALIPITEIDKAWESLPGTIEKVYVEFPDGAHTSYIERCGVCQPRDHERAKELTRRYVTAFLQAHITGDARYAEYLSAAPPDAVLREPPAAAP